MACHLGPFGMMTLKFIFEYFLMARDSRGSGLGRVGCAEQACVRVPVPRDADGPDGIIADPVIRAAFGAALAALAERARG